MDVPAFGRPRSFSIPVEAGNLSMLDGESCDLAPHRRGFSLPVLTRAGNHGAGVPPPPDDNGRGGARPRCHPQTSPGPFAVCSSPLFAVMLSPPRTLPSGFIPQCLPTKAPRPPSGALWLHEIKHDGFQVIARKDGKRVKLYSRPGNDLTWRFSLIVEALGCGRDPALSTARRSHVTTAASRRSIVSDTAGMMPA
jgi:hypothetical protein